MAPPTICITTNWRGQGGHEGARRRSRIVRPVLTESVVLAIAGGVLGVGVKLLVAANPDSVPRIEDITVNKTVLLFALAVSVLTSVLFGLASAMHSGRAQLTTALKEGGRGTSGAPKQRTRAITILATPSTPTGRCTSSTAG